TAACAPSSSTRSAIVRILRISASLKRWTPSRDSEPNAHTSRTSATISRTRRPARNCRVAWSWPMMVWSWIFSDHTHRTARKQRTQREKRSGMDVIHFPEDVRPSRWSHPVLALGNFDGVHRGHRKILDRVRRGASEHGATSVVMTFDPHPPRVVRPDKAPPLLMTTAQKLEAIAEA